MNITNKIILESLLLTEEKIIGFQNPNYGNFVVLIGSPGAGKSFVKNNLLNLNNYKYLNSDTWLEIYAKKNNIDLSNSDNTGFLHKKFDSIFDKFKSNFIKQKKEESKPINIVIESSGKTVSTLINLVKLIESSNYKTTLIYVMTSKKESLRRNSLRARKVSEDFIMQVYEKIQNNYTNVIKYFDNVWIKIGDEFWEPFEGKENVDANNKLISRQGIYKRPEDKILKIK